MQELLYHTQPQSFNWSKSLNDYSTQKKTLEWGMNPKQSYITEKKIKENDQVFNPILQIYNDKAKENTIRQKENANLIEAIAKNQDDQLKKEQTFHLINLRDRLRGFEKDPNYPIPKAYVPREKDINKNKMTYNILSNKPLSEHHYDKPENRPSTDIFPTSKSTRNVFPINKRDYNIISNKYKEYNDEKLKVDKEINIIQTEKLFYKKNDYDSIKGRFFDETKESNYQLNRKAREKTWGQEYKRQKPLCAKGQSDLYDFINMKVVNENDLKLVDEKEHNKKKRYELKVVVENYYRKENMKEMQKKESTITNKCSYQRYKEIDNRNYDIIDLKDIPYKKHSSVVKRHNLTDWQKIVNNSGSNTTFKTKGIYQDKYDCTDSDQKYDTFIKGRVDKLNKLPRIEQDNDFNMKVLLTSKVNLKDIEKEPIKNIDISKLHFFQFPKNIFADKQKFKIIPKNNEMSRVRLYDY